MAEKKKSYTKEEKQAVIKRMFSPENCSITKLHEETGIGRSTLSTWKSQYSKNELQGNNVKNKTMSSQSKFRIVLETYTMSEIELGKYCRENGLYVEDVKRWQANCSEANVEKSPVNIKELQSELTEARKKNIELAKDLQRKEKALAETTALLVLKKSWISSSRRKREICSA